MPDVVLLTGLLFLSSLVYGLIFLARFGRGWLPASPLKDRGHDGS
jgi:hypothetical protein